MTAGGISDPFYSHGDVIRRLDAIERRLVEMDNANDLESASIGAGGLRVKGGKIEILDAAGVVQMCLATDGLSLTGLLSVAGSLDLAGGSIIVRDDDGNEVFRADADGLRLLGLLEVSGDIEVAGGNIKLDADGSLRVHDDADDVVVQAGLLPNGAHGIAAVDPADGSLVDLATLAFGQRFAVVSTLETTTSTSFVDLATVGPTITDVPIGSTRRCLVIISVSCRIAVDDGDTAEAAVASVEVSGASSISADANVASSAFLGISKTSTSAGTRIGNSSSATSIVFLGAAEGLNEGLNTFRLKYRSEVGGEAAGFLNRKIFVLPF